MSKICNKCKKIKELSDFYKAKNNKDGFHYSCKKCCNDYVKQSRKRNPSMHLNSVRKAQMKRFYGLDIEAYERMLIIQNYKCKICPTMALDSDKRFCIDHDHKTGLVRGLLCHKCNKGLGLFKDNPEYLYKAFQYLTEFNKV